ncbi:MAG: hypothetical protein RL596_1569 [Bacteroidota bacterium]
MAGSAFFIDYICQKKMRKTILLFSLIGLHAVASAQQKNIVWGYLKDSITQEPIVLASVTNLSSKQTVMTSHTGRFKIQLTENQLLSFAAVGYHFDTTTFHAINLKADTLMLFLSPLTRSLANVTVSAKGMNAYQLDSIERRKDFMGDRVNYAKPAFELLPFLKLMKKKNILTIVFLPHW